MTWTCKCGDVNWATRQVCRGCGYRGKTKQAPTSGQETAPTSRQEAVTKLKKIQLELNKSTDPEIIEILTLRMEQHKKIVRDNTPMSIRIVGIRTSIERKTTAARKVLASIEELQDQIDELNIKHDTIEDDIDNLKQEEINLLAEQPVSMEEEGLPPPEPEQQRSSPFAASRPGANPFAAPTPPTDLMNNILDRMNDQQRAMEEHQSVMQAIIRHIGLDSMPSPAATPVANRGPPLAAIPTPQRTSPPPEQAMTPSRLPFNFNSHALETAAKNTAAKLKDMRDKVKDKATRPFSRPKNSALKERDKSKDKENAKDKDKEIDADDDCSIIEPEPRVLPNEYFDGSDL